MKSLLIGIALFCLSAVSAAADRTAIIKKIIGYEHSVSYDPFPGFGDCVDEGGASISLNNKWTGFGYSIVRCGRDRLLVLDKIIGEEDGQPRVRILDAIVLPKFDRYDAENEKKSKQLSPNGICMLDGHGDTSMQVLLRWGGHKRVTSKNGVLAAWGFNVEKGKIIRLDISRIVCEEPDDP